MTRGQRSEISRNQKYFFKRKSRKKLTYHLVLFGWLIYVEVLEVTSEQKVNLRLRGREDVDERKRQRDKSEIIRSRRNCEKKD